MADEQRAEMSMGSDGLREGEVRFASDGLADGSACLRFIGCVRSPWMRRGDCPKNLRQARERRAPPGRLEIAEPFRAALRGLQCDQWVFLLTWLHEARRDLALQKPRHATAPSGTFSLRSPVRPNPIGLHLVRILDLNESSGIIVIDAVDVLDGTPLLDIKPYLGTVDMPPSGPA